MFYLKSKDYLLSYDYVQRCVQKNYQSTIPT